MRKILNYLGTDGLLHLVVSLILCLTIAIFLPIWAAVLISLAIGVLKELIWDKLLLKGTPEWKDILADAPGYHFRGGSLYLLIQI